MHVFMEQCMGNAIMQIRRDERDEGTIDNRRTAQIAGASGPHV